MPAARRVYADYLNEVAADEAKRTRVGLIGLSKGWAIGSSGWRRALAEEHAQLALNPGLSCEEVKGLRMDKREFVLADVLQALGQKDADLVTRPRLQPWKLDLANRLKHKYGIPLSWTANRLHLGKPNGLRSYLSRARSKP